MKITYKQFRDTLKEIGCKQRDFPQATIFDHPKMMDSLVVVSKHRTTDRMRVVELLAAEVKINLHKYRTKYTEAGDFSFVEYLLKSQIAELRKRLPGKSMFPSHQGKKR